MRTSTAYFAGVGTVIVAVAAGLGGGYLAANVANPPSGGVQAGTQDVGGADNRRGRTGAAVAACGATSPAPAPERNRSHSRKRRQQRRPAMRLPPSLMSAPKRSPQQCRGRAARPGTTATCKINRTEISRTDRRKTAPASGRLREGPRKRTSSVRTRKSGAPNGASSGPKGVGSSSRVSRNSRRLKRGSGK